MLASVPGLFTIAVSLVPSRATVDVTSDPAHARCHSNVRATPSFSETCGWNPTRASRVRCQTRDSLQLIYGSFIQRRLDAALSSAGHTFVLALYVEPLMSTPARSRAIFERRLLRRG